MGFFHLDYHKNRDLSKMTDKQFKEFIDKTKREIDEITVEAEQASKRFDDNFFEIISNLR